MASTFPVGSLAAPSNRVASDKKFESILSSAFISSFSFSKTPNVALRPGHRSLQICAMGEGLHFNKDGSSIKKLQFKDVNKLADLVGVATFGPKGRNVGAKLVTKAAGDGEGATAKSTKVRRPRFKIIRRLGPLPGLTSKSPKGGSDRKRDGRPVKKSQYRIRLEEKQKLRFHYGVNERQLLNYVRLAGKAKGSTGQVLLQLLEMRLDNIIFRLGMASTIPQARQFVNHRHILVNGHIVDIPSYRCKPTDVITVKDDKDSKKLIKTCLDAPPALELPGHLTVQPTEYKGLVNQVTDRKWVGLNVNELLVVEYYSRQA